MIKPNELIEKFGISGLVRTADDYYARLDDATSILAKPFNDAFSGAYDLYYLGMILAGIRLAPTMTVLDFGGGVGWLSRYLQQMRCNVICLDPSAAALRLAQDLFAKYPIIGTPLVPPQFLEFDGLRIGLPDASVDRIISFAAFHHVPNPDHILTEMYRVLKPGGVVGFYEPGLGHSSAPQSQLEMKYFNVLENDIHLHELIPFATSIGFDEPRFRLSMTPFHDVTFDEFMAVHNDATLSKGLSKVMQQSTQQSYLFFLTKGKYKGDSRLRVGLGGKLFFDAGRATTLDTLDKDTITLQLRAVNTGGSTWLHMSLLDIGKVMLGARLMSPNGELLREGYASASLAADVSPGAQAIFDLTLPCPDNGSYSVIVDIVAHHVCWFESNGSIPLKLNLNVFQNADGRRVMEIEDTTSQDSVAQNPPIAEIRQGSRFSIMRWLSRLRK